MFGRYPQFDDPSFFKMGLGCARIGSMTGPSPAEAEALLRRARELGVTVFDTARSYGQGDSERVLGRVMKGDPDAFIITKLGKIVPLKARVLRPVKSLVRSFGKRSNRVSGAVTRARGGLLPVSFERRVLQSQLDHSRRALGRDTLDAVMLHSVSAAVLQRGDAMDFLEAAQKGGAINILGVSVDDIAAAQASLEDPRITLIQAPLYVGDEEMRTWCRKAKQRGKIVVAREVFRRVEGSPPDMSAPAMRAVIDRNMADDAVGVCLVGTTKTRHLDELVALARRASS